MCYLQTFFEVVQVDGCTVHDQSFAADNDWDDYEIIDPKSGKETEDQPFSLESDWSNYDEPNQARAPSDSVTPSAVATTPNVTAEQAAMGTASRDANESSLLQEAAILKTRGFTLQLARHCRNGNRAVIYRAQSQTKYLISVGPPAPHVFRQTNGAPMQVVIFGEPETLLELLAVIEVVDRLPAESEEGDCDA